MKKRCVNCANFRKRLEPIPKDKLKEKHKDAMQFVKTIAAQCLFENSLGSGKRAVYTAQKYWPHKWIGGGKCGYDDRRIPRDKAKDETNCPNCQKGIPGVYSA